MYDFLGNGAFNVILWATHNVQDAYLFRIYLYEMKKLRLSVHPFGVFQAFNHWTVPFCELSGVLFRFLPSNTRYARGPHPACARGIGLQGRSDRTQ